MTDQNSDLRVRGLSKQFPTAAGALEILQGVNLSLQRGDSLAITGPSGSGKSTLLYILGTIDTPTAGDVRILGTSPFSLSTAELAGFRNANIGFVFQDHHLLPQCTVLENVLIPALAGSGAGPEQEDRAKRLLERVGLSGPSTRCTPVTSLPAARTLRQFHIRFRLPAGPPSGGIRRDLRGSRLARMGHASGQLRAHDDVGRPGRSRSRHADRRPQTRFLQLKVILARKSFVFGNWDGVGAISWCHTS